MSSELTPQKVFNPAAVDITDWENDEERTDFIKMSSVLEICTLGIPHAVYSACKNFQENNKIDQLAKSQLYQHPESVLIEILAANFPESEREGIINVLKDDSVPFTPLECAKLLPIIKHHLTKNAQDQGVWNQIHSRKFNGPKVVCQIDEDKHYQMPLVAINILFGVR